MGFIHKNMSFSTTRTQIPQCIIRGPRDRQSLYNVYGTQHEAIKSLINSLLIEDSNQISNLIFIGDSVTVQFANFFVCDAMRAGISYTSQSRHIDESVSKFSHHITEYMIVNNRSENRILRVHYQQLNPPCLRRPQDSACANSSFASDSTTRYVYAILDHFRHSNNLSSCFGQRNYLLFNYGLHLHQKHRPHILPAIVRAVYTFAHQQMHRQDGGGTGATAAFTAVLFVETVAQVFSGSSGAAHITHHLYTVYVRNPWLDTHTYTYKYIPYILHIYMHGYICIHPFIACLHDLYVTHIHAYMHACALTPTPMHRRRGLPLGPRQHLLRPT